MTDSEGTCARLVEIAEKKGKPAEPPAPTRSERKVPTEQPSEDLTTTPYIRQNYRFTEDELRWLRRQSYNLTERLGSRSPTTGRCECKWSPFSSGMRAARRHGAPPLRGCRQALLFCHPESTPGGRRVRPKHPNLSA